MAVHNDTGKNGEDAASALLQSKGYKIAERNWRLGHLEVDIIAQDKKNIVFVEVKTRSTLFGNKMPEEYVDKAKQAHIARAANAYIAFKHISLNPRFDIVSVLIEPETMHVTDIQHIEDAFDVPMRTVGGYNPLYKSKKRRGL